VNVYVLITLLVFIMVVIVYLVREWGSIKTQEVYLCFV
jgi:hypothetical protein